MYSRRSIIAILCLLMLNMLCTADSARVSNFLQLYWPWNGKAKIKVTLDRTETDKEALWVVLTAYDATRGTAIPIRSLQGEFPIEGNAVAIPPPATGKSKTATLTWDVAADYPEGNTHEIKVEARVIPKLYMRVDLTTGEITYPTRPPSHFPEDEVKGTHLWLRYILPGKFMQGSPDGESAFYENVETQHPVELTDGYYMSIYEVTQKQYQLITGTNPSQGRGDYRPVENVDHYDLRGNTNIVSYTMFQQVGRNSFMGKLRALTRNSYDFDIPTETQWERACRGDSTAALNSGQPLSSPVQCPELDKLGRYSGNLNDGKGGYNGGHTTVGSYQCNAFGLYDMHGNVFEYCLDNFHDYDWWYEGGSALRPNWRTEVHVNPIAVYKNGPILCYVVKGGAYDSSANRCRSASRFEIWDQDPLGYTTELSFLEHRNVGFRVACTLKGAFDQGGGADLVIAQSVNGPKRLELRSSEAGKIVTYNDSFSHKNLDNDNNSCFYIQGDSREYYTTWKKNITGWTNVTLHENGQQYHATMLALHGNLVKRGTRSGTWDGSDAASAVPPQNIHVITHWVKVPAGKTLTIQPGAIVKFCPGTGILVEGKLIAEGVTFTALADSVRGKISTYDADNPQASGQDVPISHQFQQGPYPIVASGQGIISITDASYWYQCTVSGAGATGVTACAAGGQATATAEPPPDGYVVCWESPDLTLERNQALQSTLTYTMPHTDVRLTASQRKIYHIEAENAAVTVGEGTISTAGYLPGEKITVVANIPETAQFLYWEVQGMTLPEEQLKNRPLTFNMPENDLKVIARCGSLVDVTLSRGWNLLTLPGTIEPKTPQDVLQTLVAYAMDEHGRFVHVPVDALVPCRGYWVYTPEPVTFQTMVSADTPPTLPALQRGWNLAGGWPELPYDEYRVFKLDADERLLVPADRNPDGNWLMHPGHGYYIYKK